jgi:tetratricopeptide (TPR) repeat protein
VTAQSSAEVLERGGMDKGAIGLAARQRLYWLIIVAGVGAYANSLEGAFVFDDLRAIVNNPLIREPLARWQTILTIGRPVLTLSLAANYAISGLKPWSYHVFNITVHVTAALLLFGLARRTLRLPGIPVRYATRAEWLALAIALFWVLHPLQTESVTYLTQRAEALMGMFYLLTMYAVLRGATSDRPGRWYAVAVLACALGMGSKEPIATAPLTVLLYDRIFLARSVREQWRLRKWLYLGLAATWLLLIVSFQVALGIVPDRVGGGGMGFHVETVRPWNYFISQAAVILHYLRLVCWPRPLCLDYEWPVATSIREMVLPCLVVLALLLLTAWALWRYPRIGFLGAAFFIILAPTSSIMPIVDLAFEHRMYLPLAAVIALVVLAGDWLLERMADTMSWSAAGKTSISALICLIIAGSLMAGTIERNRDYQSQSAIWRSVVKARPGNLRARYNLALALTSEGRRTEAMEQFEEVLKTDPRHVQAHTDLGLLLAGRGQWDQAIEHYKTALANDPNRIEALNGLGSALVETGHIDDAIKYFRRILDMKADHFPAHFNLAQALMLAHHEDEALEHYAQANRLRPSPQTEQALRTAILQSQRLAWELATHPDAAKRVGPRALRIALALSKVTEGQQADCEDALAAAYAENGKFDRAVATLRNALTLRSAMRHSPQLKVMQYRLELYKKRMPFRDISLQGELLAPSATAGPEER